MRPKRRPVLRPNLDRLDDRCLLSGVSTPPGLSPSQLTLAYGLNAISLTSSTGQTVVGNGTGETIAIVVAYHDPNLAADLHKFDSTYGLPDPALTQTNLAGSATNDGWAGEESLDVEWAHAMAPGAKILVVEASSDSTAALLAAVNNARQQPGVAVVSMSWGGSEMPNETQYDSYFTTPAGHQGITFVAASGDSGSSSGAQWPASSPNVLSVGGTTLSINSSGAASGESVWSGSGGGYSLYEAEPAYQQGVQSTGRRSVPDVAFAADPNTGVAIYTTAPSTGQGSWEVVGGTSVGAPAWSAVIAIVDQGLALQGKGSLDGATQTLPFLYALPTNAFNTVSASGFGGFFGQATSTLTSTGLGTPSGSTLITDLVLGTTRPTGGTTPGGGTTIGGGTTTVGGTTTTGGTTTGGGQTGVEGSGGWWYPGGWWPVFGPGNGAGTGTTPGGGTTTTGGTHNRFHGHAHGGTTLTTSGGIAGQTSARLHSIGQAAAKTVAHHTAERDAVVEEAEVIVTVDPGQGIIAAYTFASPVVAINPSPVVPLQNAPRAVTAIDEVLQELEARRFAMG